MTCLYCRRAPPAVLLTESHIFPQNLGGTVKVPDLVCETCNRRISREIEQPIRRDFAPFLSWWGIRGRSRRPPLVEGTINFGDLQARAIVGGRGEVIDVHPIVGVDSNGKSQVHIIGPAEQVQRRKAQLARRRPALVWKEMDLLAIPEPFFQASLPSDSLIVLAPV